MLVFASVSNSSATANFSSIPLFSAASGAPVSTRDFFELSDSGSGAEGETCRFFGVEVEIEADDVEGGGREPNAANSGSDMVSSPSVSFTPIYRCVPSLCTLLVKGWKSKRNSTSKKKKTKIVFFFWLRKFQAPPKSRQL